ncbi:endonuclease [Actibacterium ureilyticum]|uniref:endonuclease n=1 Tax=Actibacterium ureilyticum TaxID=1590614 RepID=UPI000BAAA948|nr:endonuclease [Actibacterium ureilyticum]
MSATSNGSACRSKCWIWAAISGAVVFLVMLIGGYSFLASAFVGIIAAILIGFFLVWLLCGATVAAGRPAAAPAPAPAPAAAPATPAPAAKPAAEPAEPKSAKPITAEQPTTETAAPEPAAPPKPAAPIAAENAATKAAPQGEDYDGDGVVEGTGEGTRPAALDGPRGGTADDLKKIKGVGPKLEQLLFSLGFYHFDQIAGWTGDEVAWVDANLKGFKGRVSRDNWVEQAKLLATGGETEFSKKVDKGGVY